MSLNNSTMVHITIKMKLVKVKTRILKFNCHLLRPLNLLLKNKRCGSQDKRLTKIIRQVLAPLMKIIMKLFRTTTDMLHQQLIRMTSNSHKKNLHYLTHNLLLKKKLMKMLIWLMKGLYQIKIWVKVKKKVLIFKWNKHRWLTKSNLLNNQQTLLI